MYEPLVTHVTQKICNGLQYRIGWFCKQKINSTYRKKIRKCNTKISSKRGHGLGRGAADRGCKRACCIHFYIEPTNLHGVLSERTKSLSKAAILVFIGEFQQGFSLELPIFLGIFDYL